MTLSGISNSVTPDKAFVFLSESCFFLNSLQKGMTEGLCRDHLLGYTVHYNAMTFVHLILPYYDDIHISLEVFITLDKMHSWDFLY